jgi:hypothetical protein
MSRANPVTVRTVDGTWLPTTRARRDILERATNPDTRLADLTANYPDVTPLELAALICDHPI